MTDLLSVLPPPQCICLNCHAFASAAMHFLNCHVFVSTVIHLPQLPCICLAWHLSASAAMYLPELPCICLNCHIFALAVMYLSQLPCTCLSCHAFVSTAMYLPQLACICHRLSHIKRISQYILLATCRNFLKYILTNKQNKNVYFRSLACYTE